MVDCITSASGPSGLSGIKVSPELQYLINELLERLGDRLDTIDEKISQTLQEDRYLSRGEAATYLNVKPNTISTWITQGRAPKYTKIGNRTMFKREWLDAFAELKLIAS